MPVVTTVTTWVPLPQRRAGGGWRGAGPWLAACLAAPASSSSLVTIVGSTAQPGDAQHISVSHTSPWTRSYSPGGVAPPPKGNPLVWLWPSLQSLSNNNLCCLCSLAQLEKSAGSCFFLSKNKLTPITVWKFRLHSRAFPFCSHPRSASLSQGRTCPGDSEISPALGRKQRCKDG